MGLERLLDFLDRLLAEVRDRGELVLGLRDEVADRLDADALEAVVRADAELELLDREVLHPLGIRGLGNGLGDGGLTESLDLVDVGEDRELADEDVGRLPNRLARVDGSVREDVEAARVGQRTDYDKLTLDVTTDGSIGPREAIGEAAEILIRQLAIFTDIDRIEGFGEQAAAEAQAEPALAHGMENFPIEELELGVRSYNCLKRVGIETIGDLVTKSENELAAIPNFGKKSIEEVKETLATHGLNLRGEEGPSA